MFHTGASVFHIMTVILHVLLAPRDCLLPSPNFDVNCIHSLLQADLPSMSDPRLWMLGCKDGAEGEIMVSILNKYIAQARVMVAFRFLIITIRLLACRRSKATAWASCQRSAPERGKPIMR
jgi:hypothetical protein